MGADPHDLYVVEEDVAADLLADARAGDGPALVHTLRGFVDAGGAGEVAADHILATFPHRRLVTFDVDQLLDYRARRPTMTFDVSRWSDYEEPELVIDLVRDAQDRPFLLLHGLEPDVRWERFVAAVRHLVERFGVPLTVGVNGVPMGVPHTRPLGVTRHATRAELARSQGWFGTVQVPASVGALLEYRLGREGRDAVGIAVHVPHYLAQSSYPQAALVALQHMEHVTGLALEPAHLESAAHDAFAEVDRQVGASPEVGAVVRALEQQYDEHAHATSRNLLTEATDLPTADEIGAELERFLAEQEPPGDE